MSLTRDQQKAIEADWQDHLRREGEIARRFLRHNAYVNLGFRFLLCVASLVFFVQLVVYVQDHADAMANVLLDTNASGGEYWRAAAAVLLPVAVLLLFVAGLVLLALHIQSRGVTEFERLMEGVSRIRRDALGVARTRSVGLVVEEALLKARRAFALQLWLGRTLFVASLLLLVAFAAYSLLEREFDLVSGTLAAGSILSFVVANLTEPADKIANTLADMTQLQIITMTTAERLGVLSEYAYSVMEKDGGGVTRAEVGEMMKEFKSAAHDAVDQIERYAEPRRGGDGTGGKGPGAVNGQVKTPKERV